jgi:HSP20 family protein
MNIVRRQQPPAALATPTATEWDPFRMMRDMMGWDPFRELAPLADNRQFGFMPDFDVKETPQAYVFKADLPGMKEKDVEVSLVGSRITITGKREEEKREEKDTYFMCERSYGAFTRSFTLPEGTDGEHVAAELKDGVLAVTLPKKPEVQAKKIAIQTPPEAPKAKA